MSEQQPTKKTKGDISLNKSKTDCISELPDELLCSIVSNLTIRDATNASLMSSRWRHLHSSVTDLNFDFFSMFGRKHLDSCGKEYKEKFITGVNQFLKSYKGTQIVSFRVAYCLDIDSTDDITEWVTFALSKGVKVLKLSLSCSSKCFVNEFSRFYIIDSKHFPQGNVVNIEHLTFKSCVLGLHVIKHFRCLTTLKIIGSRLNSYLVSGILICCPNLNTLMLESCTLPRMLCIWSRSRQLKFLAIINCKEVKEIDLSATNLTDFEYLGYMTRFSFSSVPNLKRIFFRARDGEVVQHVFSKLAINLPLVETLLLMFEVQCLPEPITTFSQVKILEFFNSSEANFDVFKILSILKACPLLEKFRLGVYPVYLEQEGAQGLTMPPESVHKSLKEVRIGGFHYSESHIEFAKYMLDYAVALEQMIIEPKFEYYVGNYEYSVSPKIRKTWYEGERAKVCSRLKDHSKSSMIIIDYESEEKDEDEDKDEDEEGEEVKSSQGSST